MTDEKKFELGTTVNQHESGVRDVAVINNDLIASLEGRGKGHIWERKAGTREFVRREGLDQPLHAGLAFCLEYIPPSPDFPEGILFSGGGDKKARAFDLKGNVSEALIGHTNTVNSFSVTSEGSLLTGCWDGIARVWSKGSVVQELKGHQHGVEVLGLESGEVVTGSADGHLRIWKNGTLLKTVKGAHTHAIRKLAAHPLGFVSCANDGFVKLWSNKGEPMASMAANTEQDEGASFVYGLTVLPESANIVSAAEDSNVKIWAPDGRLLQTIPHPRGVRAVKALPNGDFVTACGDEAIRIWTQDPGRQAPQAERKEYDDLMQMIKTSGGMKEIDLSSLPDQSALTRPGEKDGAIVVCNVGGKAMVYRWTSADTTWTEVGEAMGQGNKPKKQSYMGKEWDFVTTVEVTEEIKLTLAFNKDEDPEEVAARFCALHGMGHDYKDQIVAFVAPKVNPSLIAARKQREQQQANYTSELKHTPTWKHEPFQVDLTINLPAFRKSVLKFHKECASSSSSGAAPMDTCSDDAVPQASMALSAAELAALDGLIGTLGDVKRFHTGLFPQPQADLLLRMLRDWPAAKLLPVLDAIRVSMCHADGIRKIGGSSPFWPKRLSEMLSKEGEKHQMMVCKITGNWIARRPRDETERGEQAEIPSDAFDITRTLLETLAPLALPSSSPASQLAYVMLCANAVQWLARPAKRPEALLVFVARTVGGLATHLAATQSGKSRLQFYIATTLSSLLFASPAAKKYLRETIPALKLPDGTGVVAEAVGDYNRIMKG